MKFIVQSPIKFGGKRREINAVVDLDEDTAAPLLASGDIAPHKASKADAKAQADAKAEADKKESADKK